MFIPPPEVSRVTCHLSHVTCHVSHVPCHLSHVTFFFFFTKWWILLVGGLLSTGPTPPIFLCLYDNTHQTPEKVYEFFAGNRNKPKQLWQVFLERSLIMHRQVENIWWYELKIDLENATRIFTASDWTVSGSTLNLKIDIHSSFFLLHQIYYYYFVCWNM